MSELVKSFKGGIDDINREKGVVTIAISRFDVEDHAGDITRKGAFALSFADMSRIKHCIDHYQDIDHVVGTPRRGWETDEYAIVESALIVNTAKGHDIFEYYKHCAEEGVEVEHSYCYRVTKRNPNTTIAGDDIAELQLLREYSTVIAGCNPFTPLIDLKGVTRIEDLIAYQNKLNELLRKCDFTDAAGKQIEELSAAIKGALAALPAELEQAPTAAEIVGEIRKSIFNN
uniref:hypothetical protein n=1 Tax=Alistipes sp. TaxID=1872444 RepID=UPI004056282B